MAIETNIDNNEAPRPQASAGFSGATLNTGGGAPTGNMDFLGLISRIGVSRIDASVEPYLDKVVKSVNSRLNGVTLHPLERSQNAYALLYVGPDGTQNFFAIQFVTGSDSTNRDFAPQSFKFQPVKEEIVARWGSATKPVSIRDMRVIQSNYARDMDRAEEMADTIVRVFNVTTNPEAKNATIDTLLSTEFNVSWNLSEARSFEAQLSPHGVRPRMEVAMTLNAKINNNYGNNIRDFDNTFRTIGVIGGYVEIREREQVLNPNTGIAELRYQPVFNITVMNSIIPLEGVAAVMLAAFAPAIYNTRFWAQQWMDLSDGKPQPGFLMEDPDNRGKPIILKNKEDLDDFISAYFARPHIALQLQDGRDVIPGMHRLAATMNADAKNIFVSRLTQFFGTDSVNVDKVELTRLIERRFDGVIGDVDGELLDSRYVDYLHVAAKNGMGSIDMNMRRTLLSVSDNPTDRARIIANVTHSFNPLYLDTIVAFNPDFLKWIIEQTAKRNLVITDPNAHQEARPFGSILEGLGSANAIGSVISSGITNRGFAATSIWG